MSVQIWQWALKLLTMRHLLITILLFLCAIMSSPAQKIEKADTVINMTYYQSFYSYSIQAPSFVVYKLYKGGGDVSRRGMSFREMKDIHGKKLPHFTYTKSGYDRGHLANAEDFAYSEQSLRSTFYYINIIPQHPKLNRETWKYNEEIVRCVSQNDSLIIVCGGCDWEGHIPRNCFKVVYSLTDGECIESYIYSNDGSQTYLGSEKIQKTFPYRTVKQLWKGKRIRKFQK